MEDVFCKEAYHFCLKTLKQNRKLIQAFLAYLQIDFN